MRDRDRDPRDRDRDPRDNQRFRRDDHRGPIEAWQSQGMSHHVICHSLINEIILTSSIDSRRSGPFEHNRYQQRGYDNDYGRHRDEDYRPRPHPRDFERDRVDRDPRDRDTRDSRDFQYNQGSYQGRNPHGIHNSSHHQHHQPQHQHQHHPYAHPSNHNDTYRSHPPRILTHQHSDFPDNSHSRDQQSSQQNLKPATSSSNGSQNFSRQEDKATQPRFSRTDASDRSPVKQPRPFTFEDVKEWADAPGDEQMDYSQPLIFPDSQEELEKRKKEEEERERQQLIVMRQREVSIDDDMCRDNDMMRRYRLILLHEYD